jgi:hypothetical protein
LEKFGPCLFFAGYTLAFALQLRKNHGKPSVRIAEEFDTEDKGSILFRNIVKHGLTIWSKTNC